MQIQSHLSTATIGATVGGIVVGVPATAICSSFYHTLGMISGAPTALETASKQTLECIVKPIAYGAAFGAGIALVTNAILGICKK